MAASPPLLSPPINRSISLERRTLGRRQRAGRQRPKETGQLLLATDTVYHALPVSSRHTVTSGHWAIYKVVLYNIYI